MKGCKMTGTTSSALVCLFKPRSLAENVWTIKTYIKHGIDYSRNYICYSAFQALGDLACPHEEVISEITNPFIDILEGQYEPQIDPFQGLYLHQHQKNTSSGVRTHGPNVLAVRDHVRLTPRDHRNERQFCDDYLSLSHYKKGRGASASSAASPPPQYIYIRLTQLYSYDEVLTKDPFR